MKLLKTDRGLIKVILLSIITLGIYGIYFRYAYIRDVNIACKKDGKKTPGLLVMCLLSFVTLGIYSFVHIYKMANRICDNGKAYGINIEHSGSSILCWYLFGSLLFGVGPLIAMHFEIKNLNAISFAYNQAANAQNAQ